MSESMGDTTSSASEKPERREKVLTLTTASNMLPLVRRIVSDVVISQQSLAKLEPEQLRLEQQRRTLSWPERMRRYEIQEELAALERTLGDALAEMEVLGIVLLQSAEGRVGFPTVVNGRKAFFSWQPGEDGVRHWHFATENALRLIPPSWLEMESGVGSKH
jgi:hypothetical protein